MNTITRFILFPSLAAILSTRLPAVFVCAVFAAFAHLANAEPGDLDLSFGTGGKVITFIGTGGVSDNPHSVAIQSDGKIVVVGDSWNGSNQDFAVVRYNPNGSLDTTFNGTGKVLTDFGGGDIAYTVAIGSDGKIVVGGHATGGLALARYNSNGTLDTTFNGTGKVAVFLGIDDIFGVAIQPDGKIVATGDAPGGFAVVRYDPNGMLDPTFNGTGKVITAIGTINSSSYSLALQNDGKIVVVGVAVTPTANGNVSVLRTNFAVVRYNPNGSLDTTFNGTGKVLTDVGSMNDEASSVAIQNDGQIVVAGITNSKTAVVRYNTTGSLDTSFGSAGIVKDQIGVSPPVVAIQGDGKIVVVSEGLISYKPNGDLDTIFNGTGIVADAGLESGASLALQNDGKIVVVSRSFGGFGAARYEGDVDTDGDGIFDQYETGTGIYVSPTNTGTSPTNPDTDGDGLNDGQEVNRYHSNPFVKDTDGDGFEDGFEVTTGFSPTSAASTPDALSSIRTAAEYRFNAALGISYRIEASTDFTNWTTIETNIIGAGGVMTRFYSIEGQPRRFFRSRRN